MYISDKLYDKCLVPVFLFRISENPLSECHNYVPCREHQLQNEPCHEKICLRGLRPGKTQTGAATEARYRLEISDLETKGIILSRLWTTNAMIRLRGCQGWSAPLLFAYGINRFSHDVAQIIWKTPIFSSSQHFLSIHMYINCKMFSFHWAVNRSKKSVKIKTKVSTNVMRIFFTS